MNFRGLKLANVDLTIVFTKNMNEYIFNPMLSSLFHNSPSFMPNLLLSVVVLIDDFVIIQHDRI